MLQLDKPLLKESVSLAFCDAQKQAPRGMGTGEKHFITSIVIPGRKVNEAFNFSGRIDIAVTLMPPAKNLKTSWAK